MYRDSFEISRLISASPETIYDLWTQGESHTAFTGAPATSEAKEGGLFTAHGPYIQGRHVSLEAGRRLVQTWRTLQFSKDDPDSMVEISFQAMDGATRVSIRHWNIPQGQGHSYMSGWIEKYLAPLQEYVSQEG